MRPAILCFVILFFAVAVLPAQAATISLNVSSPVQVGATFDVVVQASDLFPTPGDYLFGYGFNVSFGSIFQYLGATPGSLFDDFSGFPGSPSVAGLVTLNAPYLGVLGPLDVSGSFTLATLHFVASASGTAAITVSGNPSNLNEGLIYLDLNTPNAAIDASTTVTVAVPEAGSMILLITGIPIVILFGRPSRML